MYIYCKTIIQNFTLALLASGIRLYYSDCALFSNILFRLKSNIWNVNGWLINIFVLDFYSNIVNEYLKGDFTDVTLLFDYNTRKQFYKEPYHWQLWCTDERAVKKAISPLLRLTMWRQESNLSFTVTITVVKCIVTQLRVVNAKYVVYYNSTYRNSFIK